MNAERRNFKRFLADDRAFACLRPRFEKLGKIRDISKGGLSFEYLWDDGSDVDPSEVDIFLAGNGFYLPKMPCKVVYDFQIGADLTSNSTFHDRRCGVEFGILTEEQEGMLQSFFDNHLTGAI
jgi:hypothetical protein